MQGLLIFSSLLLTAWAGTTIDIGDLNCTTNTAATSTYLPSASICNNVQSDTACQAILADTAATPQPPTAPGSTNPRAKKCWAAADGTTFSQDSKNFAIATCPKFCGYCCQTSAYTCTNAPMPRINCATVTPTMCTSALWRTVIAQDCPNVCGFCLLGGCIDAAPDCATQPSICLTRGLESFVAANCQRTCSLCSSTTAGSSATTAASGATCSDSNTSCTNWVKSGFCSSTFYTAAQKKQFCAKSCNLC